MLRRPSMASNNFFSEALIGRREIPVGVTLVDQNGCSFQWKSFLNDDCVWHSDGHVAEPCIAVKINLLRSAEIVIPVDNYAVASHRASKQFDGGILLAQGKMCNPGPAGYLL